MPSSTKHYLNGWPFVGVATVALIFMTTLCLWFADSDVDGARVVIRATARSSVLLFCAAFMASSLVRFWKSPVSRWMLKNRRYLGFSFGVSQMIHYVAVAAYAILDHDSFFNAQGGEIGLEKLVPIVVLALLMATSFDRTAAMLGPRPWKVLHWTGSYLYWVLFLATFGKQAGESLLHSSFVGLILITYLIRVAAFVWMRLNRHRQTG